MATEAIHHLTTAIDRCEEIVFSILFTAPCHSNKHQTIKFAHTNKINKLKASVHSQILQTFSSMHILFLFIYFFLSFGAFESEKQMPNNILRYGMDTHQVQFSHLQKNKSERNIKE